MPPPSASTAAGHDLAAVWREAMGLASIYPAPGFVRDRGRDGQDLICALQDAGAGCGKCSATSWRTCWPPAPTQLSSNLL